MWVILIRYVRCAIFSWTNTKFWIWIWRPGTTKIQTMLLWLYINSKIPSIALPAKLYSTQLSLWFFFLNCGRALNPKLGLHNIKLMCFPMLTFFYLDCLNRTEFSVSWVAILPTESVLMRNIRVSDFKIVCSSATEASKSLADCSGIPSEEKELLTGSRRPEFYHTR